jgi:hypothetical protein
MPARLTHREIARNLRYCETELAKDGLSDVRRQTLEEKAAFYRSHLEGHCSECGRTLTDPVSVERGTGPECAREAVAAR